MTTKKAVTKAAAVTEILSTTIRLKLSPGASLETRVLEDALDAQWNEPAGAALFEALRCFVDSAVGCTAHESDRHIHTPEFEFFDEAKQQKTA